MHAPQAYAVCQTFEARSRFFAGMFWAGLVGAIAGTVLSGIHLAGSDLWVHKPALQLIIISALMMLLFGRQLAGVRKQEASVVLFLYISYRIGTALEKPEETERT